MQCPFCSYRRKKDDCTPHWQCPKCEKAYNKFQSEILNKASELESYIADNKTYTLEDFITRCVSHGKVILKIVVSIFLLFWGIEEFLTEGVYYLSTYYEYVQVLLGNDLYIFSVLMLFLLFIIAAVVFIGRKVVGNH